MAENKEITRDSLSWKQVAFIAAACISMLLNIVGLFAQGTVQDLVSAIEKVQTALERFGENLNKLNTTVEVQEVKNRGFESKIIDLRDGHDDHEKRIQQNEKDINNLKRR